MQPVFSRLVKQPARYYPCCQILSPLNELTTERLSPGFWHPHHVLPLKFLSRSFFGLMSFLPFACFAAYPCAVDNFSGVQQAFGDRGEGLQFFHLVPRGQACSWPGKELMAGKDIQETKVRRVEAKAHQRLVKWWNDRSRPEGGGISVYFKQ